MASLKAPSTSLQQFYIRSEYYMHAVANEKLLRLVYGTFNLALFTDFATFHICIKFPFTDGRKNNDRK